MTVRVKAPEHLASTLKSDGCVRLLLREYGSSLLICKNDVFDRVLLVLEVMSVVVGVGGKEELCRGSGQQVRSIETTSVDRCTLVPVEAL